jgi:hypothetical protein
MVPREPRQTGTIGVETRRRVKIVPRDENLATFATLKFKTYQSVNRLASRNCMIFTHTDYAISAAVNDYVSIAKVGLRSEWMWQGSRFLIIYSLISEIREVDCAFNNGECTTSILVNACANIEWSWCNVLCLSVWGPFHDNVPSSFSRAHLIPVNVLAI